MVYLIYGIIFKAFTRKHPLKIIQVLHQWSKIMIWVLGIEVELTGTIPKEQALIMPNHRSYIDILMFTRWIDGTLVSKASVRKWPIIGKGGEETYVVYVDRKDPESRKKTIIQIKKRFQMGLSVVNFPEGTTHKGPGIGDLKPGSFFLAAQGQLPIVPVALEYRHQMDAWVGDDTFLPHFIRCFGKKRTPIKVHFGEPILETDYKIAMQKVSDFLETSLRRMRSEWDLDPAVKQGGDTFKG